MKLLPCPFCGGEAAIADWSATSSNLPFDAYCSSKDGCRITLEGYSSADEAATAWNTRAPSNG